MATSLTVVAGLPGTGKSTFGKALAAANGAAVIDRDTLMGPLVEAALDVAGENPYDHSSPVFLEHLNPAGYDAAEEVALDIVAGGVDVVLIAPYTMQAAEGRYWHDVLAAQAADRGAALRCFWLVLDRETHRRRLMGRAAKRDANRHGEMFDAWLDAQNRTVPGYALELNARLPVEALVQLAELRHVPVTLKSA